MQIKAFHKVRENHLKLHNLFCFNLSQKLTVKFEAFSLLIYLQDFKSMINIPCNLTFPFPTLSTI